MAKRLILLLSILVAGVSTVPLPSLPVDQEQPHTYTRYKLSDDHHYRPTLISFLHRQPDGSQLPSIRYYRIVFHCTILPGSLYLRLSKIKPYRTVVQNRQDPSTIFGFRSVGAYSRVQIQNHASGFWLCINNQGRIVQKSNITLDSLACTFRQNSDGPYMTLISELDPSRRMAFSTFHLLSTNPILQRRYAPFMIDTNKNSFKRERCDRFMLDSQIDSSLLNRTTDPFHRLRHEGEG